MARPDQTAGRATNALHGHRQSFFFFFSPPPPPPPPPPFFFCHTFLTMAVYFECTTRTSKPKSELFDFARSVDAHKDSMAQSREAAIAGVTSGGHLLGRGSHMAGLALRFSASNDQPDHARWKRQTTS